VRAGKRRERRGEEHEQDEAPDHTGAVGDKRGPGHVGGGTELAGSAREVDPRGSVYRTLCRARSAARSHHRRRSPLRRGTLLSHRDGVFHAGRSLRTARSAPERRRGEIVMGAGGFAPAGAAPLTSNTDFKYNIKSAEFQPRRKKHGAGTTRSPSPLRTTFRSPRASPLHRVALAEERLPAALDDVAPGGLAHGVLAPDLGGLCLHPVGLLAAGLLLEVERAFERLAELAFEALALGAVGGAEAAGEVAARALPVGDAAARLGVHAAEAEAGENVLEGEVFDVTREPAHPLDLLCERVEVERHAERSARAVRVEGEGPGRSVATNLDTAVRAVVLFDDYGAVVRADAERRVFADRELLGGAVRAGDGDGVAVALDGERLGVGEGRGEEERREADHISHGCEEVMGPAQAGPGERST